MTYRLVVFLDAYERFVRLAQIVLTQAGFRVISWKTSLGAKELVAAQKPDLVILDLWLDYDDAGWETYKSLREDPETASIPIILTVESRRRLKEKQQLLKTDGRVVLLPKPYNWETLLETIMEIVGRPESAGGGHFEASPTQHS